jgi:chromosomal replication initiator protein
VCHRKGLSVLYVSSEEFTNDFIHAIPEAYQLPPSANVYRNTDVLLNDDIQFIAKQRNKPRKSSFIPSIHSTARKKQIIISSDRPPKALVTLEERLRSRFEWGLIGDIQPP